LLFFLIKNVILTFFTFINVLFVHEASRFLIVGRVSASSQFLVHHYQGKKGDSCPLIALSFALKVGAHFAQ
jgi:hypothetical protein